MLLLCVQCFVFIVLGSLGSDVFLVWIESIRLGYICIIHLYIFFFFQIFTQLTVIFSMMKRIQLGRVYVSCQIDPLLIPYCIGLDQLSESNLMRCQMRPIRSSTNQSFPATEPTSNSLIENKATVDVRRSTPLNCSQPHRFLFGTALWAVKQILLDKVQQKTPTVELNFRLF